MEYELEIISDVSNEDICGVNLEDDASFQNFFFESQGTPERFDGQTTTPAEPPDWRAVKKQALAFIKTTRDLKLISVLSQAVLNTEGLIKFEQCLDGIAQLVDSKWPDLFPPLDEDDGDPMERISALGYISDKSFVIEPIRNTPLVTSKVLGNLTLKIIERAVSPSGEKKDSDLEMAQVIGIFKDSDSSEVTALYESVNRSVGHLNKINDSFVEKAGNEYNVNFDPLLEVLTHLAKTMEKYAELTVESAEPEAAEENDESASPDSPNNVAPAANSSASFSDTNMKLTSRSDVERCFDLITQYYQEYEPSSPVPILVNRAKKLVHLDFLDIVKDVFPDAYEQVQKLGGISEQDERASDDSSSSDSSW